MDDVFRTSVLNKQQAIINHSSLISFFSLYKKSLKIGVPDSD